MKVNRTISPNLTLKLVAIATSPERSEKRVKYLPVPYGENMVKIGPIDPNITV